MLIMTVSGRHSPSCVKALPNLRPSKASKCGVLMSSEGNPSSIKRALILQQCKDKSNDIRRRRTRVLTACISPLSLLLGLIDTLYTTQGEGRDGERVLVGQDACHAWKQDIKLVFSTRGSATARQMCELSKASSGIAATRMDKFNDRFVCLNCHSTKGGSWSGIKAHTWRTGVSCPLCSATLNS